MSEFEQIIILGIFCGIMLAGFTIIGIFLYGLIWVRVESFRKEVQDTKQNMMEMFKENSLRDLSVDLEDDDDEEEEEEEEEDDGEGGTFRQSNRLSGYFGKNNN